MTTALFTLLGVALSTTDPLASIAHHRILATIEPESGALAIEDRIELLPGAGASALYIGSALQVRSLEAGGKATEFQVEASAEPGRALLSWRGGPDAGTLVIHCTASFAPPAEGEAVELEYQAMAIDALIGEQGAFLSPSAGWYPQGAEDLARFDVVVDVPEGWLAVTEGARATERTSAGRTRIEHTAPFPVDGVHLCAGPYVRGESRHGEVAVETYFFAADTSLAPTYLEATVGYLERYEALFGDYPFERFAVVENFMPTGYGMPTFTLLGQRVVRLPFIVRTSLGHEVLHNWWGNSVYVDYQSGNWCEGLTSYGADYAYKVDQGPAAARRYRKDLLKAYADYVAAGADLPLARFTGRTDNATRAIGYGKAAMVFHMMRARIGAEAFDAALRWVAGAYRWRTASWADFFAAFERVSGVDLAGEREQWVEREGALTLSLGRVGARSTTAGGRVIDLELRQQEPHYAVDVPVRITAGGEQQMHTVRIEAASTRVTIPVPGPPQGIDVDPGYDLFRSLHDAEMEATLSQFFGDAGRSAVIASTLRGGTGAQALAAAIAPAASTAKGSAAGHAKALLTNKTPYPERLPSEAIYDDAGRLVIDGHLFDPDGEACVLALAGAAGPELHVITNDPAQLQPLTRKLSHYGRYSYLVFRSGHNVAKGNWSVSDGPLSHTF